MEELDLVLINGFGSDRIIDGFADLNLARRTISVAALYNAFKDSLHTKVYIPSLFDSCDNLPIAKYYGISLFDYEIPLMGPVLAQIRKIAPNALVFAGGTGVMLNYATLLQQHPELDFLILGDGTKPTMDILIKKMRPEDQPNAVTRTTTGVAALPDPEYAFSNVIYDPTAFIDYDASKIEAFKSSNYYDHLMFLTTNQGCPFNCYFCGNDVIYGKKVIYRRRDVVLSDLKQILSDPTIWRIFLTEANANYPTKDQFDYLEDLFKAAIDYGFDNTKHILMMFIRPSFVTEEYVALLSKYGDKLRYSLFPGLENFSNEGLRLLGKTETQESLFQMYTRLLSTKGLAELGGNILFGYPGDSEEILQENIDNTLKVKKMFENTPIHVTWNTGALRLFNGSRFFYIRDQYPDYFNDELADIHDIYGLKEDWLQKTQDRMARYREATK